MIESKTVKCWEKRFLCKWSHFRISINVQQCQYLINKIFITNQKTENHNIKVILYLPTMPWQFKSAHTFAISYFIWCITIINVSIILYVLALCVCVCARLYLRSCGFPDLNRLRLCKYNSTLAPWYLLCSLIIPYRYYYYYYFHFTSANFTKRKPSRLCKKSTTVDSWLFAEFHNSIAAAFLLCESIEMFIISDTLQGNCTIDV